MEKDLCDAFLPSSIPMMIARIFLLFMALVLCAVPVQAVTLRIETARGDSVFFAPVGDAVTTFVSVASEGLLVAGVEVFLRYDPRLFTLLEVQGAGTLLGRVLRDTSMALSDSVAVIHVAEADLVGKAVSGTLFAAFFQVVGKVSGFSPIGILEGDVLRQTSYSLASQTGMTFKFDSVRALLFADLPPRLSLPGRFEVLEDDTLVVDLRPLAQDAVSGVDLLTWRVTGNASLVAIEITDTLTAVLIPVSNFAGDQSLVFTVTDPSGGMAEERRVLGVWPVNDPPEIIAGVLPDSVVLGDREVRINLLNATVDVDGDDLVWSGVGAGVVQVVIENRSVAKVFAPVDWVGEAEIILRVTDPEGGAASHLLRVVRAQKLNTLPGDIDGDGVVGFSDFLAFAQAFGKPNPPPKADLNGDGRVDFSDFLIFAQHFGKTAK